MSAACRAHHVRDAVSRFYGVSSQSDRFLIQLPTVMYSNGTTEPFAFRASGLFPASRNSVMPITDLCYIPYVDPVLCAYACDSKITGRAYTPRVSGIRDLYGLSVRRDGWQRSSLELHCRRYETAVVYMCIIGVPRGTGTKFYTRVSPFTASAHEYACFSCVSAWIGRLGCNISTWYSIYAFIRDKYKFNVLSTFIFFYIFQKREKRIKFFSCVEIIIILSLI